MLRTTSLVAKVGIRDQGEVETLVSHLKDRGYLPLIRSMFTGMFGLAKLAGPDQALVTKVITPVEPAAIRVWPPGGPSAILGDIFLTDDFVYALAPSANTLQASIVGFREAQEALSKFCADVEEGIKFRFDGRRVRGMEFDWKAQRLRPSSYIRRRYGPFEAFSEEAAEGKVGELKSIKPDYSSEDGEAAKFIVDVETRQFILKLAQLGKMRSKDAAEITKPDIVQRLLFLSLVAEEYLLTCKQDQHTICVVSSRDHLTKEPTASLRCSVCGRSFPEENLQAIYGLTDRGKKLVTGSRWMYIWISELLKENGVREEGITWRLEASGEELDVMVEDFDSRIFFELKDREFGLGDAYPFAYRITRYEGAVGVIATMDKVSTDAQQFFKEETQRRDYPQIRYLEGTGEIEHGVVQLIEDMSLLQARRLVQPLFRVGFDLWPIVEHWINTRMKRIANGKAATATATAE